MTLKHLFPSGWNAKRESNKNTSIVANCRREKRSKKSCLMVTLPLVVAIARILPEVATKFSSFDDSTMYSSCLGFHVSFDKFSPFIRRYWFSFNIWILIIFWLLQFFDSVKRILFLRVVQLGKLLITYQITINFSQKKMSENTISKLCSIINPSISRLDHKHTDVFLFFPARIISSCIFYNWKWSILYIEGDFDLIGICHPIGKVGKHVVGKNGGKFREKKR